jgi:arylformamidase
MKIYDISMEIKEGMLTYPGDPEVRIKKIPKSASNLSELTLGSHTGTHVDVKRHINNKGLGVDRIPLEKCIGPCKVLDLTKTKFGDGIRPVDLANFSIKKNDIILLKTKNSSIKNKKFRKDFVYLTEEGAEFLVNKKIKAVGIDYLSIQKYHTGSCAAHCVLLDKNVLIFEGINLSKVRPGKYTFIGLPLKIKEGDGSPIRAILVEGKWRQ